MSFLYEEIEFLRKSGHIKDLPKCISKNINPKFELRPYQIQAFENFVTYFENDKLCRKPTQVLFHMATGSGKTVIMGGAILYLYRKGYRNFLFFVNLSTIVQKTKDNFIKKNSNKYIFSNEIIIDGERVKVKEVENFQDSDNDSINICFTTTQGLHSDMWGIRENAITFDDFQHQKIVLISDEAHHLNVDTRRLNKEEEENYRSWQYTVERIFDSNRDNVLLEFTATCDLNHPLIKSEYESRIVYDYPLYKFRQDKYSKEIKTLRSDISIMERAIQAIILSQYRLKIFQEHRLLIKPVVLFKAKTITESKNFMKEFNQKIQELTGKELERIAELTTNPTMKMVYQYFEKKDISFEQLAQELKDAFSEEHCISANDDKDSGMNQVYLNNLEDKANPYRAIFEVKKLDEGWDVLNLFDIVRLYETRQSGKKISATTISEAQLIGRGSRYCPFKITDEQEKYKRKYDSDVKNPLRICEELYYHCQNDSRYISELHSALREIGIDIEKVVSYNHKIKEDFKSDSLYKNGFVFVNERFEENRENINSLDESIRDKVYSITIQTGNSGEDIILDSGFTYNALIETHLFKTTIREIAELNYSIVLKAMSKYSVFKFNTLKSHFPTLKSTREFITSDNYLGRIEIEIISKYKIPTPKVLLSACSYVLGKIEPSISIADKGYKGSKEFKARRIYEIFKDKVVNYTNPVNGGVGVSQNDSSVLSKWKIDLKNEDWYVFEDNYGTSEEKAFVAYFKQYVNVLKERYDKVYLIRNERQLAIYSFEKGERFEPDYILFLHSTKSDGYEQIQVFIEPKGLNLIKEDNWKEKFLLELEEESIPTTTFVDDNKYKIWGFHFFNDSLKQDFSKDMTKLINYSS